MAQIERNLAPAIRASTWRPEQHVGEAVPVHVARSGDREAELGMDRVTQHRPRRLIGDAGHDEAFRFQRSGEQSANGIEARAIAVAPQPQRVVQPRGRRRQRGRAHRRAGCHLQMDAVVPFVREHHLRAGTAGNRVGAARIVVPNRVGFISRGMDLHAGVWIGQHIRAQAMRGIDVVLILPPELRVR